jgi:hypothetical protein
VVAEFLRRRWNSKSIFVDPLRSFSKKNQITQACTLLGVHVGQTFTHSMITSSSFAPSNMCFLGIVIFIRGSSALMLPVAGSTSHVMSCSMKWFILSVNQTQTQELTYDLPFFFSPHKPNHIISLPMVLNYHMTLHLMRMIPGSTDVVCSSKPAEKKLDQNYAGNR